MISIVSRVVRTGDGRDLVMLDNRDGTWSWVQRPDGYELPPPGIEFGHADFCYFTAYLDGDFEWWPATVGMSRAIWNWDGRPEACLSPDRAEEYLAQLMLLEAAR